VQCAGDIFFAELKDGDLTPRQLAVLIAVAENTGSSQTAIGERTGIDRSTSADVVRRLHKKGLLRRHRTDADARAYEVEITPTGRRVLEKAAPLASRVDQRVLALLPASKREQFIAALKSIIEALQPVASETTE